MLKHLLAAAAATLACTSGAWAQNYYVTTSVGSSRLNADCSGTTSCDNTDTAFKLLGGYKFAPNMAAELGYFSFGKAKAAFGADTLQFTNNGIGGGIAFMGDITNDWNYAARLGLVSMRTKVDVTTGGLSGSDSDRNVQLYVGLGAGYKVSKNLSLDLSLDLSKAKYNKNGVDASGNLRALSVGLTFGF